MIWTTVIFACAYCVYSESVIKFNNNNNNTPEIPVYLSLSLQRYMVVCPYHSTDPCLFVPITPEIPVYLSLSLKRYMFICPYHSRDTCLFVPITPNIHVYLSLSLQKYMFVCPYHSRDTSQITSLDWANECLLIGSIRFCPLGQ